VGLIKIPHPAKVGTQTRQQDAVGCGSRLSGVKEKSKTEGFGYEQWRTGLGL
jgi:hypothetical protein